MYGYMSLVEKVATGTALMLVQYYMPPDLKNCEGICSDYFRNVLVYWCGGGAILGLLSIAVLSPMKIGQRYKR